MLRNVSTINDLKNEAVKIKNREKVIVYWPQFGKKQEQAFDLERDHCVSKHAYAVNNSVIYPEVTGHHLDCLTMDALTRYCIKNGIITFVNADGKQYITKKNEMIKVLMEAGYKFADIYVPFSNGEEPEEEEIIRRWKSL